MDMTDASVFPIAGSHILQVNQPIRQIVSIWQLTSLFRARGVKLGLAVRGEQSPVLLVHHLAVVTLAQGLPCLVESLKVEHIHAPFKHAADAFLPVALGVLSASDGSAVVRAASCCKFS